MDDGIGIIGSIFAALMGFVMGCFMFFILISTNPEYSYKQGQIDALTGKVKYELVTKSDSSKIWEEIQKAEK